jgi:maltose O-acetyltransferase
MLKALLKKVIYSIYARGKQIHERHRISAFKAKYSIDPTFRFNGEHILFYGDGRINCGADSYIGSYSTIQAYQNCKVVIGKGCSISHNVRIYTQTNIADQDFSATPLIEKTGDVVIEDYAWIGANVFINPGVKIGSNSIVGANAVVTKNVEPYSIVGGVPAVLIRYKKI